MFATAFFNIKQRKIDDKILIGFFFVVSRIVTKVCKFCKVLIWIPIV